VGVLLPTPIFWCVYPRVCFLLLAKASTTRRATLAGTASRNPYPYHFVRIDDDDVYPRETSPHQDSASTAPSGTPPPAQPPPPPQTRGTQSHSAPTPLKQPPPPPQTRGTQSHSAPTPLKRPMLTPEGGPRPRVKRLGTWTLVHCRVFLCVVCCLFPSFTCICPCCVCVLLLAQAFMTKRVTSL